MRIFDDGSVQRDQQNTKDPPLALQAKLPFSLENTSYSKIYCIDFLNARICQTQDTILPLISSASAISNGEHCRALTF